MSATPARARRFAPASTTSRGRSSSSRTPTSSTARRTIRRSWPPSWPEHADVVYGSRFLGGPHRVLYYWHSVANTALTRLSNMLSDLNLTDMETGFKVFRTSVLKDIHLQSDRFGFEP